MCKNIIHLRKGQKNFLKKPIALCSGVEDDTLYLSDYWGDVDCPECIKLLNHKLCYRTEGMLVNGNSLNYTSCGRCINGDHSWTNHKDLVTCKECLKRI